MQQEQFHDLFRPIEESLPSHVQFLLTKTQPPVHSQHVQSLPIKVEVLCPLARFPHTNQVSPLHALFPHYLVYTLLVTLWQVNQCLLVDLASLVSHLLYHLVLSVTQEAPLRQLTVSHPSLAGMVDLLICQVK